MGQVISNIIKKEKEVQITAGIDLYQGIENEYPVYSTLSECREEADVIIDFASPKFLTEMLSWSVQKKVPIVLCTTGLSGEQLQEVEEASEKVAILRSANMSLGVNTLFRLLETAAQILGDAGYDIEIVEKHHNQKVDAPSGTALAMADVMNKAMDNRYSYKYDRSAERAKRNPNEIGIMAVRGGTIVGEHEVIFAGMDEVIEIKHTAFSRAVFGKGAVQAAKFLKGKEAGMYNMQDVIAAV